MGWLRREDSKKHYDRGHSWIARAATVNCNTVILMKIITTIIIINMERGAGWRKSDAVAVRRPMC